jgi:metallo-beta-lactamase superfamily protein
MSSVIQVYPTCREFVPGIHWLGGCSERHQPGHTTFHSQASTYLLVGPDKVLMFDTGAPGNWTSVRNDLDRILGDRPIDILIPSHPETPHTGNMARMLDKYPNCRALGNITDYHILYPDHASRLESFPLHTPIPLGGGMEFVLVDAVVKDLPNTVWGYEKREQVMFVADAFAYQHHSEQMSDDEDEPLHQPGECRLLLSEMPTVPAVEQATHLTRGSLSWTSHMDAGEVLDSMHDMFRRYPTKYIAPTHGNIVDDFELMFPIMREAYTRVYREENARIPA